MTDVLHSNICIKSNIQIVATERPFKDREYLSKVFEKQALEKFPSNIMLTPLQEKMKMLGTPCTYSDGKVVIPGVLLINGKYYSVIRCPKLLTCKYSGPKHGNCNKSLEIIYRK
ncbi:hypothetical protein ACUZ9P_01935 [Desulfovibrio sp. QI0430]